MCRMQLELEIFRQLQMKRKEAPRPSDSSDNSAPCGVAGGAQAVIGIVSTSSVGVASASVDSPVSSVSDRGSDPSSCPKSSTSLRAEPVSLICHNDLPQTAVNTGSVLLSSHLKPLTLTGIGRPPAATASGLQSTAGHRHLAHRSQPVLSLSHRGSRPARPLAKLSRPRPLSCGLSVDIGGNTPATLSQTVSRCDSDMSPAALSTPETSSHLVTSSHGVSHPANTDSTADASFAAAAAAAAAAVLSKPATLSQDADNSADIKLEAVSGDAAVSAHDSDGSMTRL